MLGDLNANHTSLGYNTNNRNGQQIITLIDHNKLIHIGPHFPTRLTNSTARSPDIALTNSYAYANTYLRQGPLTPSDHYPIIATISTDPIQIPIQPRLQFKKTNWTEYKRILGEFQNPDMSQETPEEIDQHIETFNRIIKSATEQTTPTIKYRMLPGAKPNRVIHNLQDIHNKLMQLVQSRGITNRIHNLILSLRRQLREEYKRLSNKTWEEIVQKIEFTHDPKTFFHSIKRMMGTNSKYVPYIVHNGEKLFTPEEQEAAYREHWRKIFTADDPEENTFDYDHIEEIENSTLNNLDHLTPYHQGDLDRLDPIHCPPVTLQELNLVIKKTKHKAPGPNKITAHQLKNLPANSRAFLVDIFNQALSAGYFPDVYKKATMTLIPKSGTPGTDIRDKRPISLLNVDGKLLDKILMGRLNDFLDDNNLQNPRQHGFRPNRGTQSAIATLYETISRNLGNKLKVDIVCRDVAKAFDRIWHTGLKYKLTRTGLHDCYTRLLCDYLTDRTASIKIGQYTGPEFPLETGVPQGTSLSPTLFNFYVHDLPEPLDDTDYIQYADDLTQIIALPGPPQAIASNTTHAIAQISNYENKWKIQTNVNKFKLLNISRKNTGTVRAGEHFIPYTNSATVLGLKLNSTCITQHVNQRKAIAQKTLNRLKRFRGLREKTKRKLYITMVRPQLLYPIVPLNQTTTNSKRKLQRVQNDALRFIDGSSRFDRIPSHRLHNRHNLDPINIYLYNRSVKVWTDMELKNPEIYGLLQQRPEDPVSRHRAFPSAHVTDTIPQPMFV